MRRHIFSSGTMSSWELESRATVSVTSFAGAAVELCAGTWSGTLQAGA